MNRKSIRVALLAASFVCCGCATTTINAEIRLPSRAEAMQQPRRVVVMPFSGPYGADAARVVSSAISDAGFHTLLDRRNEAVTAEEFERGVQAGDSIDADAIGAVGATVLISGDTGRNEYSVQREQREVRKCVAVNDAGECLRSRMVRLFDQRELCTIRVSGRVTRVSDNVVLFDRAFSRCSERFETTEGDWPARHEPELCREAFGRSVDELVTWITPFRTVSSLVFRRIKDSPSNQKGIDFVRASMFDRAATHFSAALTDPGLDEESIGWVRHNIAVLMWATGDYDGCVEQASMALDALGPRDDIVEVRNRCAQYAR